MRTFTTLALALFLGACAPLIARYDPVAYDRAVSLKVECLDLVGKADQPYAAEKDKVEAVQMDLRKAYEYALGRPLNEISAKQWAILVDPNEQLVGGFFKEWAAKGTLGSVFAQEKSSQISKAFDSIIALESGKIKN
jgi:hypothetical protein